MYEYVSVSHFNAHAFPGYTGQYLYVVYHIAYKHTQTHASAHARMRAHVFMYILSLNTHIF